MSAEEQDYFNGIGGIIGTGIIIGILAIAPALWSIFNGITILYFYKRLIRW